MTPEDQLQTAPALDPELLSAFKTGASSPQARPRTPKSWEPDQLDTAQRIYQIGRELGAPDDHIRAALSTGIVESGFRNVTGDKDLGPGNEAYGPFQQRPVAGWGTKQQVQDTDYAARKFYDAASKVPKYQSPGHLAAQVQRPRADLRGRYDEELPKADELFNQFQGSEGPQPEIDPELLQTWTGGDQNGPRSPGTISPIDLDLLSTWKGNAAPDISTPSPNRTREAKPYAPQGPQITSNDAAWHLGANPDEAKRLGPKAYKVLQDAVAEDQRKKAAGQVIQPPSLEYQNQMRAKAGLKPTTAFANVQGGVGGGTQALGVDPIREKANRMMREQGLTPEKLAQKRREAIAMDNPILQASGLSRFSKETSAQGAAGVLDLVAGVGKLAAKGRAPGAQAGVDYLQNQTAGLRQMAGEAEEQRPMGKVAQVASGVGAGLLEFAPLTLIPELGLESVLAKIGAAAATGGAYTGVQAVGRNESAGQVAKDSAVGAATFGLLGVPLPGKNIVKKALANVLITGGGTTAINMASGQPFSDAATQGLVMTLMRSPDLLAHIKVKEGETTRTATEADLTDWVKRITPEQAAQGQKLQQAQGVDPLTAVTAPRETPNVTTSVTNERATNDRILPNGVLPDSGVLPRGGLRAEDRHVGGPEVAPLNQVQLEKNIADAEYERDRHLATTKGTGGDNEKYWDELIPAVTKAQAELYFAKGGKYYPPENQEYEFAGTPTDEIAGKLFSQAHPELAQKYGAAPQPQPETGLNLNKKGLSSVQSGADTSSDGKNTSVSATPDVAQLNPPGRVNLEARPVEIQDRPDGGFQVGNGQGNLIVRPIVNGQGRPTGDYETFDVYVQPEARRQGVATRLYAEAQREAGQRGGKLFSSTEQTEEGQQLQAGMRKATTVERQEIPELQPAPAESDYRAALERIKQARAKTEPANEGVNNAQGNITDPTIARNGNSSDVPVAERGAEVGKAQAIAAYQHVREKGLIGAPGNVQFADFATGERGIGGHDQSYYRDSPSKQSAFMLVPDADGKSAWVFPHPKMLRPESWRAGRFDVTEAQEGRSAPQRVIKNQDGIWETAKPETSTVPNGRKPLKNLSDAENAKLAAAKDRLNKNLAPENLHDITDIARLLPDAAIIAKYHVINGARGFAEFSKRMIDDVGDWVEPHLKELYAKAGGKEEEPHHSNFENRNDDGTFAEGPIVRPVEPTAEPAKPERATSVKNATVKAERALRGLDDVERELPHNDKAVWAKAKHDVEHGIVDPDELAREVSRKPRPLNEDETVQLLVRRTQLHNNREEQMQAAEAALAKGDKIEAAKQNLKVQETERLLGLNEEADTRAGTQQARAFRIRQLMAKEDFSLAAMERRARVARAGDELTVPVKAHIKELHDQIEKLNAEKEKMAADHEAALTEQATRKLIRDERFKSRGVRRTTSRKVLDDDFDALKKQLAAVWKKPSSPGIHPMGLATLDPEGVATKIVLKMARNRIQANFITAEALIDEVHKGVSDTVDLTKRQVSEMISGYGKTSKPSDDPIEIKLNELKSVIASNLGTADILEKGIRPERRGFQRPKPTQEMRDARRKMLDALKANGIEVEKSQGSPEELQQSAMDRMKTVARNRLEDLKAMVDSGQRTVRGKSEIIPDAELKGLRAEVEHWNELVKKLDDPAADDKAIENKLKAVEKSIADMGERLRTGDLAPREGSTVSPWSKELGEREQVAADLRKQVADARKAAQPKADPEQQRIDNAIAAKTRALEDIKEELRTGKKENKGTQSSPWSPELGKVARELADLQKQRADIRKAVDKAERDVGRAQREIETKLKAAEKALAETQERIRRNDLLPKQQTPRPTSPELEAARAANRTASGILADMRAAAKKAAKPAPDSFEVEARKLLSAHKALNTRLEKQAAEYQRRIDEIKATGKPYEAPAKKDPFARTSAERLIEERVGRLKQQFEADNRKASLTPMDWVARLIVGTGRAAKLTYVGTLGKLTSAASGRIVMSPVEDLVGHGVGKIFPELYKGAAAEGPGSTPEAVKVANDLYKGPEGEGLLKDHIAGIERLWKSDTWRQMIAKLTTGQSQQDILYGKEAHETDFLGIPGQVHGTFKEPVRQVTFYRQFRRRLGQIAREGKQDIHDPQVQMGAAIEAWNDAARAIFMQRNFLSDGFNNMVAGWERSGKAGPKTMAMLARLEFPITRVPVNVAAEGLNYTFGMYRALGETGYRALAGGGKGERFSLNESFKKMTPEQKDSLMRAYKKGGLGLAMVLWGYLQPQHFGGFFQKGDKRDKDEPGFDEMQFFGHRIPAWATHIPILFPAQMGATFRRIHDAGQAKANPDAGFEALGSTAKGVVSHIPFYETPGRFFSGMEGPRQASRFAGEQVRGFIPGFAQEWAKKQDKNPDTGNPNVRTPEGTFMQRAAGTVKLGVPDTPFSRSYSRQTVPINEKIERADDKQSAIDQMRTGTIPDEAELKAKGFTPAQIKAMQKDAKLTDFQVTFSNAPADKSLERFERMDANQRSQVQEAMEKKAFALKSRAEYLLDNASDADKQKRQDELNTLQQRLDNLGIEPRNPNVRQSSPFKSGSGFRAPSFR